MKANKELDSIGFRCVVFGLGLDTYVRNAGWQYINTRIDKYKIQVMPVIKDT